MNWNIAFFCFEPLQFFCFVPIFATGSFSMSAVAPSSPTSLAGPALVQFKLGLFREVVQVPAGNRSYRHAKRLAAEIIERKVIKTSHRWPRFHAAVLKHFEGITQ